MKSEKRRPKPGFCLLSAVVWAMMAAVWIREALLWRQASGLGIGAEPSGVWLRAGLAALSAVLAVAWLVCWIRGRKEET